VPPLELLSENRCFGGVHRRYRHHSRELACPMVFAVFLPPAALPPAALPSAALPSAGGRVPALWWLSGLTCTDENVMQKAGAQRLAAALGLALVAALRNPRGYRVAADRESGGE
jgi:S-formylglutathione hydrolase